MYHDIRKSNLPFLKKSPKTIMMMATTPKQIIKAINNPPQVDVQPIIIDMEGYVQ
jgi:hypothetical protein